MTTGQATADRSTTTETARVPGEALAEKIRSLLHEGNVRRITIRNDEGHPVIEIPVTAGVVAAVVAPVLVAVAAIAALASHWDIEIDRAAVPPQTIDLAGKSTEEASAK
ncbi:MAG: hypothetical protein QOI76_2495 [Frankiales bacterium]|jgi:hypothetical protein|nr:hypothetical protein [Frankiales bacterium]